MELSAVMAAEEQIHALNVHVAIGARNPPSAMETVDGLEDSVSKKKVMNRVTEDNNRKINARQRIRPF